MSVHLDYPCGCSVRCQPASVNYKLEQTDYNGDNESFNIVAITNEDDDNVIHHEVYYDMKGSQVDPNNLISGIYIKHIIHLDGRIEFEKIYIK